MRITIDSYRRYRNIDIKDIEKHTTAHNVKPIILEQVFQPGIPNSQTIIPIVVWM